MHLAFHAQEVYYAGALGGEIINVSFQEHPDPAIDYSKRDFELPPSVKGVFFSANTTPSLSEINVDWCDGKEESGGELIKKIELTKTSLKVTLTNNDSFDVSFETDDNTFQDIKSFLTGESQRA